MPFEPFNYAQAIGGAEEIRGLRSRNALFDTQRAAMAEEQQRNALIRDAQARAMQGDQNALNELRSYDPTSAMSFEQQLGARELEALTVLNRAAQATAASENPGIMARFHLSSPAVRRAAQAVGFDIEAALAGERSDDDYKAGAAQLAEITGSMLAPKAGESFTLSPGQRRYNALGEEVAAAPPDESEMSELAKLQLQDALARARDAEGRAFTATENEKQRAAALEKDEAEREAKRVEVAQKNAKAFEAYEAGIKALKSGLEGTVTGPALGRLPAVTAKQQTANLSVAGMAPLLKDIFRQSGEGTFSNIDQSMLLGMVPDRTTEPEARDAALFNIDAIVRAKLGMPPQGTAGDVAPSTALELPEGWTLRPLR